MPLLFMKLYLIFSTLFSFFFLTIFSKKLSPAMSTLILFLIYTMIMNLIPLKPEISQHLSFFSGLSTAGFLMSILSIIIMTFIMISLMKFISMSLFSNYFSSLIILIIMFCLLSFSVLKIIFFYVFFEASLLPMFLVILGWGYQPERLKAGLMMIFYTLVASMPFLIILIFMNQWGLIYFDQMSWFLLMSKNNMFNNFIITFIFLSLLVKLPMFLTHLWLPQAHVEAPVAGSMVLAAILLKLGGYGIIRLSNFFTSNFSLCKFLFVVSMFGGALATLICIQQIDLKVIVAYSSVSHMALMVASIFTETKWGLMASLMILFSHGFSSSGLFFGVNSVYQISGSRSILINSGLLLGNPTFVLWWSLLCLSNMAAPPTLNLVGEILACLSLFSMNMYCIVAVFLFLSVTVFYNLCLYSNLSHSSESNKKIVFNKSSFLDNMVLFLHVSMVFLCSLALFIFMP